MSNYVRKHQAFIIIQKTEEWEMYQGKDKPFKNKVWLSTPTMHGEEFLYMKEAYDTNWMSTVGANIDEVERLTAEKIGCKYAVALSCGTAALHLAMKVAGVKRGQHVLCSSQTLHATGKPMVESRQNKYSNNLACC